MTSQKQISVRVNGTTIDVPAFSSALDVLCRLSLVPAGYEEARYSDNPVVGVLINGKASALGCPVSMSCTLQPVHAYDTLGKRIYRHSICYLLGYASRLVCPERNLVIGHSLGDGFFFTYDDGKEVSEALVSEISDKMEALVRQALEIEYVLLSNRDAMDYFQANGFADTALLLSTTNNPAVPLYRIGSYMHTSFEPVVPNTRVLEIWELRPYASKGMLLRYPNSRNIKSMSPFVDNKKLFSVFEEYRTWAKILKVSSIGQMNRLCAREGAAEYVRLSEALQNRKIAGIADSIASRGARAVFISGPSSSGKTTFSKKLCEQLELQGFGSVRISIDDFYLPPDKAPRNEDGSPDFEALEALDLRLFDSTMQRLLSGEEVDLPRYDFKAARTYYEGRPCRMDKDSLLIVEGIHGLNPRITRSIPENLLFKVYISALTQLNIDDHNRVSTTDNRILRRIVRDNRTRNKKACQTLGMWFSVARGEKHHVFPFQNNADIMFNSALDYEIGVLSPFAQPLLRDVKPSDGEAYCTARRLLDFLENVYPIDSTLVPGTSILREFIGQSDYE